MRSIVIIPTYNERENIEELINQILNLKLDIKILVVDDNSPDGTGRIVDRVSKQHPWVSVIHREKKLGLGSAYLCGFKYALREGFCYIFTMDADLSHLPGYLLKFLKEIEGADLILGSRYIEGGGVVNWNPLRRILSKSANIIAKKLLNLGINDSTTGLRCYSNSVLSNIHLDKIQSDGYAFQIEILDKIKKMGSKIKEMPIIFYERREGCSKISRKEIVKVMLLLFRLKWNHQSASS